MTRGSSSECLAHPCHCSCDRLMAWCGVVSQGVTMMGRPADALAAAKAEGDDKLFNELLKVLCRPARADTYICIIRLIDPATAWLC